MENDIKKTNQAKEGQVVVFSIMNENYAIPVDEVLSIVRFIEFTPIPNSPDYILGFINLRGKVITLVDLRSKFGLLNENLTNDNNLSEKKIMVIDSKEAEFGVLVDDVLEVLTIDYNKVNEAPDVVSEKVSQEYIKGVIVVQESEKSPDIDYSEQAISSITSNDRLLLLLDLQKILNQDEKSSLSNYKKEN